MDESEDYDFAELGEGYEGAALDIGAMVSGAELETAENFDRMMPVQVKRKTTNAQDFGVEAMVKVHRERGTFGSFFDARRMTRGIEAVRYLPEPGESLHVIVGENEFSAFDFIGILADLLPKGAELEALTFTTLGMSKNNGNQLAAMVDAGRLRASAVRIVWSDFFEKIEKANCLHCREVLEPRGIRPLPYRNHTKVILLKSGNVHLVSESSANIRSCSALEQFAIFDSKPLYEFHDRWITTLFNLPKK